MNLNNKKGAALVEMAIILPLLLLIVFGICEFGRALFIKNTINLAAREGARRASVSYPFVKDTLVSDVKASIQASLHTDATVDITPEVPRHGIDSITVSVQLPFTTVVPLLITQLDNITLSTEASMRYE